MCRISRSACFGACLLIAFLLLSTSLAYGDTWVNVKAAYAGAGIAPPPNPAKDFDFWLYPTDAPSNSSSKNGFLYEDKGLEMVGYGGGQIQARHHHFYFPEQGGEVTPGSWGYGCVKLPGTYKKVTLLKSWWTDGAGARIPNTRSWGLDVELLPVSNALDFHATNLSGFNVDLTSIRYGDAVVEPTLAVLDPDTYTPPGGWASADDLTGLVGSGLSQEDWTIGLGGDDSCLLSGADAYAYPVVIFDVSASAGQDIYPLHSATIIMAIPEPASLVLFGLSLAAMLRRRTA